MEVSAIVSCCSNPSKDNILQHDIGGNVVLKIHPNTVVKFGSGVTEKEANNQIRAFQLLDSNVVRVPKVHQFFTVNDIGYLVMEYIEGRAFQATNPSDIDLVIKTIHYLTTFSSLRPGNLSGGHSQSSLFPEGVLFDTVTTMTAWFNERLFADEPTFSFSDTPLVLCHLDIAPRNLRILDGTRVCLLDWASAGYYPRVFEFCTQCIMGSNDTLFNERILQSGNLTPLELTQKDVILRVWSNEQQYTFRSSRRARKKRPLTDPDPISLILRQLGIDDECGG